jgi:hypothetical protein
MVCMAAACEEPSFRAAAAFGDGPLVIAASVREKLRIIAKESTCMMYTGMDIADFQWLYHYLRPYALHESTAASSTRA